jgi:DNA-binding phage protein
VLERYERGHIGSFETMAKTSDNKKHKTAISSNKSGMIKKKKEHKITMLDHLSRKTGISKTWMAEQIGMSYEAFYYALQRGLRPAEIEILEAAFREVGRELIRFKVPEHLKQEEKEEAA